MDAEDVLGGGRDTIAENLINDIDKDIEEKVEEENSQTKEEEKLPEKDSKNEPSEDTIKKEESSIETKKNDENIKGIIPEEEKDIKKKKIDDRNERIKMVIVDDKFNTIISYFKKIKNPEIPDIKEDNYNKNYGWFNCGKKNEANGSICELGKDICPNCMKKTQKIYKLKPHYLINSNGRICTYKKNKIYCLGKLTRVESETKSKENEQNGIKYSISYTCGHTGQCEPCKNLTSIMDKYFDANLMKKLKKRDETNLN